jgi:hypothetical protein
MSLILGALEECDQRIRKRGPSACCATTSFIGSVISCTKYSKRPGNASCCGVIVQIRNELLTFRRSAFLALFSSFSFAFSFSFFSLPFFGPAVPTRAAAAAGAVLVPYIKEYSSILHRVSKCLDCLCLEIEDGPTSAVQVINL